MSKFIYKAKDGPGKIVQGELDATSKSTAIAQLDALGYSPIWVREKDVESRGRKLASTRIIKRRDVTVFTLQLASLIRSGVPILRALSTVEDQTENLQLSAIVSELSIAIRDGKMLSDALAAYPRLFPELYVNMVRSGESTGKLDVVLMRLSEAREKEDDIRRKVQAAIAYPVLIVIVGIATVFVLLAFFLPRITCLFKDYTQLPLPTRILMGISDFFAGSWHWILLMILLFSAVFRQLAAMEKGKLFMDRIKLHLPFLGRFSMRADIARFARTFALAIETGIPIDQGIKLSSETLRNAVLKEEMEMVRHGTVHDGMPFSTCLKKTRYFPSLVSNMAAVGEEAGRLDESMIEIAGYYEKEVEQYSRIATSLIEPILILVVGAIVGFIVAAMLLPIFRLSSAM